MLCKDFAMLLFVLIEVVGLSKSAVYLSFLETYQKQ